MDTLSIHIHMNAHFVHTIKPKTTTLSEQFQKSIPQSWIEINLIHLTYIYTSGADPGFQVRGTHLKKLRRAKGGAKIFEVFRVKNHDFTPKKITFFPILGGGTRRVRPP